jgi:hypothetical protein
MKKILSLLLIVMLIFFSNIKTVALNDNVHNKTNIEYTLQNNDMIQPKFDYLIIKFKDNFVSIIENKINNKFDYTYNKFVIKRNSTICLLTEYNIVDLLSGIESKLTNNYLLLSSKPRSDKKNSMVTYFAIRGPCSLFNHQSIYLSQIKRYEEKI